MVEMCFCVREGGETGAKPATHTHTHTLVHTEHYEMNGSMDRWMERAIYTTKPYESRFMLEVAQPTYKLI